MRLSTGQRRGQLFARKSIEAIQQETKAGALRRTLGPLQLMLLGVGCIVGAGVYVLTGTAAAHFAGPGVVVSFAIAGFACALTGLCYAELASAIPVAGSSYPYCYAALGEVFAWILGWLLVLEYGLACSTLAVGFSGYLSSLSQGFGVTIPAAITNPTIRVSATAGAWIVSRRMNLIAVVAIGVTNAVLVRGVAESARVNNVLVAIKTAVLATFVIVGIGAVVPHNWHPLIPVNEGGFTYGWQGVLRGASVLFFAYF